MFEARQLVFYYAVTPVHMGAGSAIGAIDSPIQREVHTRHPMFAGAGLKGALRHHVSRAWPGEKDRTGLINRIFGPDTGASDFAGALSLTDAQLVALPVRSLKGGFAWVSSPVALARLKRLAELAGVTAEWKVPGVAENQALMAADGLLVDGKPNGKLILEAFEFKKAEGDCAVIAKWLAENAFTEANAYFADKLKTDLVVLSDTDFAHFARHAMVVEPHVRINDESGTADDGGLFYVENLPPESILVGLAQASIERYKKGERDKVAERMDKAQDVLDIVLKGKGDLPGIAGKPLQIGGDASTGRGLVIVQAVAGGEQ
ncbi:MAG: type III-B CRISPR module RAMP protein Cmr4 [Pseudomonadota bacterium]|nr:type III-B CRISPR module RAMP protein Cmr4 [Pseudomonadota bacterium]